MLAHRQCTGRMPHDKSHWAATYINHSIQNVNLSS